MLSLWVQCIALPTHTLLPPIFVVKLTMNKTKTATVVIGGLLAALSMVVYLGGSVANQAAFALSGSNDKCVTGWQRDDSDWNIFTICDSDRDAINEAKQDCREQGDFKCSSSQTGQGAFSNNPNREDNGEGVIEKFSH